MSKSSEIPMSIMFYNVIEISSIKKSRLNELFSNIMNKQTEHLETIEEETDDNSVFDSAEGIDNLSYDDFKQEISMTITNEYFLLYLK